MHSYSQQIAALFAACTELRQSFNAIERQAEVVQEISMNASVTAAQTGAHVRTCAEIANQIAVTGRRMRVRIASVRTQVNQITNLVLTALIHEMRLGKYQDALAGVASPSNRRLLQGTIEAYVQRIFDESMHILKHAHQTLATLPHLTQCQNRLFAALSAFEIASIDLQGSESQVIASLVESLNATIEEGTCQIERIGKVLSHIKSLTLSMQGTSHKELVRAKIRAA